MASKSRNVFSMVIGLSVGIAIFAIQTGARPRDLKFCVESIVAIEASLQGGEYYDREVHMSIKNEGTKSVILYGIQRGDKLDPARFLLTFDEKENSWKYPTKDSTAMTWADESSLYKDSLVLQSGAEYRFSRRLPSQTFCGKRLRFAAWVGSADAPAKRIFSESFTLAGPECR